MDNSTTEIVTHQTAIPAQARPRPWTKNPAYPSKSWDDDPSPILDANGEEIFIPSQWLEVSDADIDLILTAVNAL